MRQRRFLHILGLAAAFAGGAVGAAHGQSGRPSLVPGYAYTLRVSGHAGSSPVAGPGTNSYVGRVSYAGARGRMDIVDGGVEMMFAKGDYILFDSTEIVVVHPATEEFLVIGPDALRHTANRMAVTGVVMTTSDEKVSLDSLGVGDTVSGVPTRRYRLSLAFNMNIDAPSSGRSRIASESTTDYWVGSVPGLPSNSLLRSNGLGMSAMPGLFATLGARVDSASARMGQTIALRTISTTRIAAGPGQQIETHQSSEVSDLARRPVDQSLLVLPDRFKPVSAEGGDAPSAEAVAKWKTLPKPRG